MPEDVILGVGGDYSQFYKQGEAAVSSLENRIRAISKIKLDVGGDGGFGRLNRDASEFDKTLEGANKRVLAFTTSLAVFGSVSKALHDLVKDADDVQRAMIGIQSVMNTTNANIQKLSSSLFDLARNTGSSFKTAAEGAQQLARQGLSAEETLKRLNTALILSRISGESLDESITSLTATMNNFNREGLSQEQIVNKIVAVNNHFLSSSKDISEAIARIGTTAQDVGVDFDHLLGLIASAKQATGRDGSAIANGLGAIFNKVSSGQLGEQLKGVINVSDNQNALATLKEIAEQYQKISIAQQTKVADTIGGGFRANELRTILQDLNSEYSTYTKAVQTASQASDEAVKQNEALNQSFDALKNNLSQNLTKLFSDVGSKTAIEPLTDLLKSINEITSLLDKSANSNIGQGFLKGIGDLLSGPGLIFGVRTLVNLFSQSGGLVERIFQQFVLGNTALKQQASIQEQINNIVKNTSEERYAQLQTEISQVGEEKAILNLILEQNAALEARKGLYASLASSSAVTGALGKGPVEFGVGAFAADNGAAGGIASAVTREKDALIQRGYSPNFASKSIFIGSDPRVGVAVGNLVDEPSGTITQGVNRAISEGKNPSTYGVPNFALGPKSIEKASALRSEWDDLVSRGLSSEYFEYIVNKAKEQAAPLSPENKTLFLQKIFPGNLRDDIYEGVKNANILKLRRLNARQLSRTTGEPYFGPPTPTQYSPSQLLLEAAPLSPENKTLSNKEIPQPIPIFGFENDTANIESVLKEQNRLYNLEHEKYEDLREELYSKGQLYHEGTPYEDIAKKKQLSGDYAYRVGQKSKQNVPLGERLKNLIDAQHQQDITLRFKKGEAIPPEDADFIKKRAEDEFFNKNFKGLERSEVIKNKDAARLISYAGSQALSPLIEENKNIISRREQAYKQKVQQDIIRDLSKAKIDSRKGNFGKLGALFREDGLVNAAAKRAELSGNPELAEDLLAKNQAVRSQRFQMGGLALSFGAPIAAGFAEQNGYNTAGSVLNGIGAGAALGSFLPGAGSLIGAGIGGGVGLLGGALKNGQPNPDELAKKLQDLTGKFNDSSNAASNYLTTLSQLNNAQTSETERVKLKGQAISQLLQISDPQLQQQFSENINNPAKLQEIFEKWQYSQQRTIGFQEALTASAQARNTGFLSKYGITLGNSDDDDTIKSVTSSLRKGNPVIDNEGKVDETRLKQIQDASKQLSKLTTSPGDNLTNIGRNALNAGSSPIALAGLPLGISPVGISLLRSAARNLMGDSPNNDIDKKDPRYEVLKQGFKANGLDEKDLIESIHGAGGNLNLVTQQFLDMANSLNKDSQKAKQAAGEIDEASGNFNTAFTSLSSLLSIAGKLNEFYSQTQGQLGINASNSKNKISDLLGIGTPSTRIENQYQTSLQSIGLKTDLAQSSLDEQTREQLRTLLGGNANIPVNVRAELASKFNINNIKQLVSDKLNLPDTDENGNDKSNYNKTSFNTVLSQYQAESSQIKLGASLEKQQASNTRTEDLAKADLEYSRNLFGGNPASSEANSRAAKAAQQLNALQVQLQNYRRLSTIDNSIDLSSVYSQGYIPPLIQNKINQRALAAGGGILNNITQYEKTAGVDEATALKSVGIADGEYSNIFKLAAKNNQLTQNSPSSIINFLRQGANNVAHRSYQDENGNSVYAPSSTKNEIELITEKIRQATLSSRLTGQQKYDATKDIINDYANGQTSNTDLHNLLLQAQGKFLALPKSPGDIKAEGDSGIDKNTKQLINQNQIYEKNVPLLTASMDGLKDAIKTLTATINNKTPSNSTPSSKPSTPGLQIPPPPASIFQPAF